MLAYLRLFLKPLSPLRLTNRTKKGCHARIAEYKFKFLIHCLAIRPPCNYLLSCVQRLAVENTSLVTIANASSPCSQKLVWLHTPMFITQCLQYHASHSREISAVRVVDLKISFKALYTRINLLGRDTGRKELVWNRAEKIKLYIRRGPKEIDPSSEILEETGHLFGRLAGRPSMGVEPAETAYICTHFNRAQNLEHLFLLNSWSVLISQGCVARKKKFVWIDSRVLVICDRSKFVSRAGSCLWFSLSDIYIANLFRGKVKSEWGGGLLRCFWTKVLLRYVSLTMKSESLLNIVRGTPRLVSGWLWASFRKIRSFSIESWYCLSRCEFIDLETGEWAPAVKN